MTSSLVKIWPFKWNLPGWQDRIKDALQAIIQKPIPAEGTLSDDN